MSLIVSISLIICCLLSQSIGNFDPDIDICNEPKLNGAVIDDDNQSYIFKGLYYWKTRSLDKEQGIDGYAQLVEEKWPEIKNVTKTIFTVKTKGLLTTVFVENHNWFGYQKGVKIVEGNTSNWPEFDNLTITAAFSETLNGSKVFILHSNNKNFSLYDFSSLEKPKVVRKGWAKVLNGVLRFLDTILSTRPGDTVGDLLDVRAGLTYHKHLLLMSEKSYCSVDLNASFTARECKLHSVKQLQQLLGCPLDLSNKTTTLQTTVTTTEPTVTTVTTVTIKVEVTNSTLTVETDDTDIDVPQDTTEYSTICENCVDSTKDSVNDSEKSLIRKNSEFWLIVILVTIIVIVICLMISIIIISKLNRKRPKGEVYFIK